MRTTSSAVILVLGKDYDTVNLPDITPYMEAATVFIDDVVACAAEIGEPIGTTKAELLERYMAAQFYLNSDAAYTSRSTDNASGSFTKDPECYQKIALALDSTGCLKQQLLGNRASVIWLGKNPTDQIPYRDRR